MSRFFLAALLFLPFPLPGTSAAFADTQKQETPEAEQNHHPQAPSHLEEIIVTGSLHHNREFDVLQGTNVLSGEALGKALSTTLGDTLDALPGLSQTAFAPGVSRPIIRGLGGDRIRILVGGIGTIDASAISPDHDVAAALDTAERIEVLRGPATLLYGNNAVGGVINILDGRIPDRMPENTIEGFVKSRYALNAGETSSSAVVKARLSENFALHADGAYQKAGDITVPVPAVSRYRQEAENLPVPAPRDNLANTALEKKTGNLGASWVKDGSFFGVALSGMDKQFGVPGDAASTEATEDVQIVLRQYRLDAMGGWQFDSRFIEEMRFRASAADYEHKELEGTEVGTVFKNKGYEARLHLVQAPKGALTGAFGLQTRRRTFSAIGDEAFTPDSVTRQTGAFIVEELTFGAVMLEAGARLERQSIRSSVLPAPLNYSSFSTSAGLAWKPTEHSLLGLNIYRTERAPSAEELLSNGPHLATGTYEMGDSSLSKETAKGGEITFKIDNERGEATVNLFYVNYDDFIMERFTGATTDGLPVAQFGAAKARFSGFEIATNYVFWDTDTLLLGLSAGLDYVRATDRITDTPLPRIPPLSLHLGLDITSGQLDLGANMEIASEQTRVTAYELPTAGYERLDLSATWHFEKLMPGAEFLFQVNNALNAEIRYHTSPLKDRAPAAGRDIRLGLKVSF